MPKPSKKNKDVHKTVCGLVRRGLLAASVFVLMAGCGTVHIEVPAGHTVTMLDQDRPAAIKVERTLWYALWGGKPLSDNSTAAVIQQYHLTQVRVTVVQGFWDTVVNGVTCYFSFVRRTMIIEGNPGP
jgi:hypothetical protein